MPGAPPSATPWETGAPSAPPATWNQGQPGAGVPMSDSDARMWAMLAHLSGIVFAVIGPLVIWLIKKDESPFVNEHGREALNFQITVVIAIFASVLLFAVGIGFITLPVVAIAALVLSIMAGVKANAGEYYRYPLALRLVK